jgi:hypothetical protein
MANKQHLKLIKNGVEDWNAWRAENPIIRPNLNKADLRAAFPFGAELRANLSGAFLIEANFSRANLTKTDLSWADLADADLYETDFSEANLSWANLSRANLHGASLAGANLRRAGLIGTNLRSANLNGADFTAAKVGWTAFANTDLSTVKGLETVRHVGPSTIGIDSLYLSQGHIPEVFLHGAGIPEEFITQMPTLIASVKPIQSQSCFISYSHRDEEFARRLHSAMRSENLRVWYAPEEMKGGMKLHDQIFQAIQVHDRLLLVLSTNSMKSEWVITELKRAMKVEREEDRRKLFPMRLVDFEAIRKWECFDTDSGKDLANELREYYIPDFSNWKDHDAFEREFSKLLRDLRATEA